MTGTYGNYHLIHFWQSTRKNFGQNQTSSVDGSFSIFVWPSSSQASMNSHFTTGTHSQSKYTSNTITEMSAPRLDQMTQIENHQMIAQISSLIKSPQSG